MLTKTYGIKGEIIDATFRFHAGKTSVKAHFTGGVLDPLRRRPATLITSNQVAMQVIEHSQEFTSGYVYLISANDDGLGNGMVLSKDEKKEAKKANKANGGVSLRTASTNAEIKESGVTAFPDVTALGQAVNILMDRGASAETLETPAEVLSTAAEMKISFPNLSLK